MTLDYLLRAIRTGPRRTQILAVAAAAIVLTAAGGFAIFVHPARVPLFAQPLRPEQLAEVQDQLAQWNFPFTPSSDNVMVDASRRNDTLLRLSLAGVPHAHLPTTNETLATIGALTPQAVIDAQTRSGLADDIAIALRSVAGVDDARVIVAPERDAEFADESASQASASVRLILHPGATLSRDAVNGMRAFVAASVAGLDPSRVTILDDRGVALGDRSNGSDDTDALQRSLQSALDAALGAGASIVRVSVAYTQTATEARDVRRVPVSDLPIDRTAANESYADGAKRYQKVEEHDDRGSETRETVTQSPSGAIAHISTAVLVDAQRNLDLAAVRMLVSAAVGFDRRRGDTLDVQAVDFHHTLEPRRDGWMLAYGVIAPAIPTLIVVIGFVVFARMATPVVARLCTDLAERASVSRASRVVAGYAPSQVRGALAHEPPHTAAAIISALPAATAAAVLELYPQHEREAIVARMQRAHSSVVPRTDEILGRHG